MRVRGATSFRNPSARRKPAQPDLALYWTACCRRKCRSVTGWARESRLAVPDARATSNKFGSSLRVTGSRISGLSARPDFVPHRTALRGGKRCRSTAGWARNSMLGLRPACTRRNRLGTSIRVTDPEVPALSAQARLILSVGWPVRAQNADRRPDGHETRQQRSH